MKLTPVRSMLRQRPLLTVDEVVTPQVGNCTIFARYVEAGFATQIVLNARLTRFYERDDWKKRLSATKDVQPLLLERGISLNLYPVEPATIPAPNPNTAETIAAVPKPTLELAASALMAKVAAETQKQSGGKVQAVSMSEMRSKREKRLTAVKEVNS